jgi:hypothetical protein
MANGSDNKYFVYKILILYTIYFQLIGLLN